MDQDIYLPELLQRPSHHGVDVGARADVTGDGQTLPTLRLDLLHHRVEPSPALIAGPDAGGSRELVRHGHVGPVLGQLRGDGATHAPLGRRSCDQGDFSL